MTITLRALCFEHSYFKEYHKMTLKLKIIDNAPREPNTPVCANHLPRG